MILTVRAVSVCGGGNHIRLSVTGDATATLDIDLAEERGRDLDPKQVLTDFLALYLRRKTPGQIRTELMAGIPVSIGT